MNPDEKREVEESIKNEMVSLKETIRELEELTKPIPPENAIGRLSRMEAINSKSVNEAGLRSARDKLAKLEFALNNIDSQDFGKCHNCKNPIPIGRIMAMPESNKCVNCAHTF